MREPLLRTHWVDPVTKARGYMVIDHLVDDYCAGGIRMNEDVTLEEVERLARVMTYKYKTVDSPTGGAKCGIAYDYNKPDAEQVLKRFLKAHLPLFKHYYAIGADLGTSHAMLVKLLKELGRDSIYPDKIINDPKLQQGERNVARLIEQKLDGIPMEGIVTGYGVAKSTDEAWKFKYDKPGTVSIQGFGSVGGSASLYLARMGYKIEVIVDIKGALYKKGGFTEEDIKQMIEKRDSHGVIDRNNLPDGTVEKPGNFWLEADVDILIPAAVQDVIREDNYDKIKAKLIVEAANIPCRVEAEEKLFKKGIIVIPDMIANAGAVGFFAGVLWQKCPATPEGILEYLDNKLRNSTRKLMEYLEKNKLSPRKAAEMLFDPKLE